MTDAKHTPGPWRLFLTPDGRKLIGIGELTGEGVADCGFGTWRSGEEQLSNARLIAAAPQLLEALKEAVTLTMAAIIAIQQQNRVIVGADHPYQRSLAKFRAAIAKAEGRDAR